MGYVSLSAFCDHGVMRADGDDVAKHTPAATHNEASGDIRSLVQAGSITGPVFINGELPQGSARRESAPSVEALYAENARQLAPAELRDRERELDDIARFCAGDESYLWWQAPPWAGKSALVAWFASNPPEGVRVVSFFVSRSAGQGNGAGFVDDMVEQLSSMANVSIPEITTPAGRRGMWSHLLPRAAESVRRRGERLVVVIDGLDEDAAARGADWRYSIASLLPISPPEGVRILVTSRPHPIVDELPDPHPMWNSVRMLEPSIHAAEIRRLAKRELRERLSGDALETDFIGFLTASGGALTVSDFAELTAKPAYIVEEKLGSVFGRSLRLIPRRPHTPNYEDPQSYEFAHETLRTLAEQMLADVSNEYLRRIHRWAQGYQERDWPVSTPQYLMRPYAELLASHGDEERLRRLAVDPARHDHILSRSRHDAWAFDEIDAAETLLGSHLNPILWWSVRLAVERDRLRRRNQYIPEQLPAVWARLGYAEYAEGLARSLPSRDVRIAAYTLLVNAVAESDPQMASRLARRTRDSVGELSDRGGHVRAYLLIRLGKAMARIDHDVALEILAAAERLVRGIDGQLIRMRAITALAEVAALLDQSRAKALVYEAEENIKEYLPNFSQEQPPGYPYDPGVLFWRSAPWFEALTEVVHAIITVSRDVERAERLIDGLPVPLACYIFATLAEQAAKIDKAQAHRFLGIAQRSVILGREGTLVVVRAAIVLGEYDRAESSINTIILPELRISSLGYLAEALAVHDPDRAERLLDQAEHELITVTDSVERETRRRHLVSSAAVSGYASRAWRIARDIQGIRTRCLAIIDAIYSLVQSNLAAARTFAEDAERLINEIDDQSGRAWLLRCLTEVVIFLDPSWAEALATETERLARAAANAAFPSELAGVLAVAAAGTGQLRRTEQLVDTLVDPVAREHFLASSALAAAQAEEWEVADRCVDLIGEVNNESLLPACSHAAHEGQWDRCESWTHAIRNPEARIRALGCLAEVVAGIDRSWAQRLLDNAEIFIASLPTEESKGQAQVSLAVAMARIEKWESADLLAHSLGHEGKVDSLRLLAVAAVEFGYWTQAKSWIGMVTDPASRAYAALPAVQESATTNPQWARSICAALVESLSHMPHYHEDVALYHVARTMSLVDVDWAGELAQTIIRPSDRARALASVAATSSSNGIEKSRGLAREAEQTATDIVDPLLRARTTAAVAVILSSAYPDRTDRLAEQIEKDVVQIADPLTRIGVLKIWIDTAAQLGHIDRVERLVHCIPDPQVKADASARAVKHLLDPAVPRPPMHADSLRHPPLARLVALSLHGPRWLEILPLAAKLDPNVVTADYGTAPPEAGS